MSIRFGPFADNAMVRSRCRRLAKLPPAFLTGDRLVLP